MEAELLIANDKLVAFIERRAIGEALVVEERAVAALQVFDEVAAALAKDRGMAAAHGGHIDRHFAVGTAADDGPIAIELEARARSRTFDKLQKCHAELTARSKCRNEAAKSGTVGVADRQRSFRNDSTESVRKEGE